MNCADDWTKKIHDEISKIEKNLSPADQRRFHFPLFLRLAKRVAAFSPECEICQSLQCQITNLSIDLTNLPGMTKRSLKGYLDVITNITKHLKKTHGLVEERQYVKRYVLMGLTFGLCLILLGLILLSFGVTIFAMNIALLAFFSRVLFSYTIGYFLDRRARKRGKVI